MADPDERYFQVESIVRKYVERNGFQLPNRAIDELLRPGQSFNFGDQVIDAKKLETSLDAIFAEYVESKIVERHNLISAMKKAPCHYLWFC